MSTQDAIVAITALFIIGMIWLRTRMQYAQSGRGALHLELAGRIYFGSVLGVLAVGWLAAPLLGREVWPGTAATPTLMRVVWCLATYYIFIVVHRVLKTRGAVVFGHREEPGSL